MKNHFFSVILPLFLLHPATAQFREDFNAATPAFTSQGLPGWNAITGDGTGIFTQRIENGAATLRLDARPDKRNIWYAFIHRDASGPLNLKNLGKPGYGLRITARVKPSHGPRRVNLYLKSQSSDDDFLREFDLPVADEWYEISMTTANFRHTAGRPLLGQVSFMDWGNTGVYELAVDYLQVDVVKLSQASPDQGQPLPYRPPLADAAQFGLEIPVAADVTVDRQYPDVNLAAWVADGGANGPLLAVDGSRIALLRWDLSSLKGKKVKGPGQFEFYAQSVYRLAQNPKDFGEVRICEVLGGTPDWTEDRITLENLLQGRPEAEVFNEQTIVDVAVTPGPGGKTVVTISQPVLQRLVDGRTKGLVIKPLGAISAVLRDADADEGKYAARLRLNAE
jgi:hypothetical protein